VKQPALAKGIILPGERRMTGGKSLNGGVWLDIDGRGRIEMSPDQALSLAVGIMKNLGIEFELEGPPVGAA
jgi:hypothetical protein